MKFLFAFALLFGAAQAEATTIKCSNYRGDVAYVSFGQNEAKVTWATARGPNSPNLRFTGYTNRGGMYRSFSWSLEVERMVFQTGVGTMWLRYSKNCHDHYRPGFPGRRPTSCHHRNSRHDRRDRIGHGRIDRSPRDRSVTLHCNGI